MPTADGSIVFSVDLDDKKANQELNRLNRKIQSLNEKIYTSRQERLPLVAQSEQLAATLDSAKAKLEAMRNASAPKLQIKDQEETVRAIQTQWNNVQRQVERYDAAIQRSTTELGRAQTRAGEIEQQLARSGNVANRFARGIDGVNKRLDKFLGRIVNLAKRTFVFSVITVGLRGIRSWFVNVIKSNDDAVKAIAKLKGAFLTLAQPLVNVIIPAITTMANLLTTVVNALASVLATLFGTTIDQSREAAKNLYDEANALDETDKSAKKAKKSLAAFDEIQKLSNQEDKDKDKKDDDKIAPDFSDVEKGWLKDILGDVAGWVTAATMLAGIALIAIGAATGSLGLVVAGLVLLGIGLAIGADTGVLQSWVDILGLNNVQEFVVLAILLAGITIVAIGAATANIAMVIAGLVLLGTTIAYAEKSGMMKDWADSLGLARAAQYITAALMIAGFALVVIGAATGNVLMVIAGIALFAAGVYVGMKTGVLKNWWETLGLDKAENFITAALLITGIALVIFGIASKNILMFIAGVAIIYAGYQYGKENGVLDEWWKVLNLEKYAGYITAALMIAGFALVVFGIILKNVLMISTGIGLFAAGIKFGKETGQLDKWWNSLNLDRYANYITAALMIAGFALLVFGIIMTNVLMMLGGVALIGAGIFYGKQTGTLDTWWDALGLPEVPSWVSDALLVAGMALVVFGIILGFNVFMIVAGLGLLGVSVAIGGTESNAGSVLDSFLSILNSMKPILKTLLDAFTTIWNTVQEHVIPVFTALAETLVSLFEFFEALWEIVKPIAEFFAKVFVAKVQLFAKAIAVVCDWVVKLLGLLGELLSTIGKVWGGFAKDAYSGQSSNLRSSTYAMRSMPSIASYNIPHLATGAVIPPNREFLAVLGDQKSGTNIEAPASEIENAVMRGIQRAGGLSGGSHTAILEIDKRVLGRVMWEENETQSSRMGVRIVQRANT